MIKQTWQKILLISGTVFGAIFLVFRLFKSPPKNSDTEEIVEELIGKEKKRLEQEIEKTEEKVYSDKEIEDKFNS